MKLEQIAQWLAVSTLVAGVFWFGITIGGAFERMRAIEQGVAYWRVNEKTGETTSNHYQSNESRNHHRRIAHHHRWHRE